MLSFKKKLFQKVGLPVAVIIIFPLKKKIIISINNVKNDLRKKLSTHLGLVSNCYGKLTRFPLINY